MEKKIVKGVPVLKGLKALRKARNLSQEELAERLGVSSRQVCRWETGECRPLVSSIPMICEVLGCSLAQLLGNSEAA